MAKNYLVPNVMVLKLRKPTHTQHRYTCVHTQYGWERVGFERGSLNTFHGKIGSGDRAVKRHNANNILEQKTGRKPIIMYIGTCLSFWWMLWREIRGRATGSSEDMAGIGRIGEYFTGEAGYVRGIPNDSRSRPDGEKGGEHSPQWAQQVQRSRGKHWEIWRTWQEARLAGERCATGRQEGSPFPRLDSWVNLSKSSVIISRLTKGNLEVMLFLWILDILLTCFWKRPPPHNDWMPTDNSSLPGILPCMVMSCSPDWLPPWA